MERLWDGYHEERTREWLMTEPDPDVLEELLGLKANGLSTKAALEAKRYITVKKPFHEGFQDTTFAEITAEESPVLTAGIVASLLDGYADRLARNEALTPSLLAEGIKVLDAKEYKYRSALDIEECVPPLLQIWGDDKRAAVGKELRKRLRGDLAERLGLRPKRAAEDGTRERESDGRASRSEGQLRFL